MDRAGHMTLAPFLLARIRVHQVEAAIDDAPARLAEMARQGFDIDETPRQVGLPAPAALHGRSSASRDSIMFSAWRA